MNYPYPDTFARFYDLIYHQLRDTVDHGFFMQEVLNTRGKVLEVGTGTGRFFLDAIHHHADIYGIDISESMLDVLKDKLDTGLFHRISKQSILDFSFEDRFDLIIAPFRVFMHLLDKDDQIKALNNIHRHLHPGGRFIFDTFIPDLNQLIKGFEHHKDFEGEYETGKYVKRYVSTRPELITQIINITFTIEWDEDNKVHSEEWKIPLRYFFRYELEHLLARSDFRQYHIYGDFQRNELNETSREFLIECTR